MTPKTLRSIRITLGFSLDQFAARFNISRDDLEAWESGDRPIEHDRLAKAFTRLGLTLPNEWPPPVPGASHANRPMNH